MWTFYSLGTYASAALGSCTRSTAMSSVRTIRIVTGLPRKSKNVLQIPCEVAHIIPWHPGQRVSAIYRALPLVHSDFYRCLQYWPLVSRLLGVKFPSVATDSPQNALLLCQGVHNYLGDFLVWFDDDVSLVTYSFFV
jgi:hypothetical protein